MIKIFCDGCGTEGAPHQIGEAWPRAYCDACHDSVKEFYAERDLLHDACKDKWDKGLEKIIKAWEKAHPQGKLPDR